MWSHKTKEELLICKKGSRNECKSYKGISMLSIPGKVYASTYTQPLSTNSDRR